MARGRTNTIGRFRQSVCEEVVMNGPVTETQWYIARDGKQHGPLTDIEMRTFVAHSYLRPGDLIWRPGMAEWMPAPQVFPAVFPAPPPPEPAPAVQPALQQQPHGGAPMESDFDNAEAEEFAPPPSTLRRLMTAAAVMTVIGGGAFALANYQEPLMRLVTGSDPSTVKAPSTPVAEAPPPAAEPPPAPAATPASGDPPPPGIDNLTGVVSVPSTAEGIPSPAAGTETQTAVLTTPEVPAGPPSIVGSKIDERLQKIPAWVLLKSEYPDWYVSHIAAAEKMVADKRPDSEVATHLTQGLVTLRRQNAERALLASADSLRKVATAFLDNLKALQTQSVTACYGFISKGETSPAVVQMMQTPETATTFNAHVNAVFSAISEGTKTPTKHDVAIKTDYDTLIKELAKIGWKEDDLKTFSNPRLLSKQPPEQVCKMVLDWFVAHLAVKDKAVQDRLLFETLKPVVTG